jgi:hypothetical protein
MIIFRRFLYKVQYSYAFFYGGSLMRSLTFFKVRFLMIGGFFLKLY